ncbi:MAG TPA: hypothetical protein VGK59_19295 [Ohtaekwangia sp.]
MLFGLVVVFPLHFTIQSAFKRRERALEYFSLFKGRLMALYYSINIAEDLTPEKKQEGTNLLKRVSDQVAQQLEAREGSYELTQRKLNEVYTFIQANLEELSKRNVIKMIRYMSDVTDSTTYLITSITHHRTIAGLRFYSIFFILVFPFLHAPILLSRLEGLVSIPVFYVLAGVVSILLVTLNNFQTMIEYPFDPKGVDNVKLKEFKLDV